ncbi:MAG TPA: hypothetical protein VKB71_01595, partial [Rhizomicrobium sp.]|nr:hypothetical protein [Rhizomicrobium sp.]
NIASVSPYFVITRCRSFRGIRVTHFSRKNWVTRTRYGARRVMTNIWVERASVRSRIQIVITRSRGTARSG